MGVLDSSGFPEVPPEVMQGPKVIIRPGANASGDATWQVHVNVALGGQSGQDGAPRNWWKTKSLQGDGFKQQFCSPFIHRYVSIVPTNPEANESSKSRRDLDIKDATEARIGSGKYAETVMQKAE